MKKKRINKDELFFILSILIIVGFMVFVLADHLVTTSTGETSYNLNEDVGYVYNITINNTDTGGDSNITAVNITLPDSFLFIPGDENGTDSPVETFSNTTTVLHWINASELIMSDTNYSFWFNATASDYGTYQINVTTYNLSGSSETLLTVTVNDTSTTPNVSTPVYPVSYGNYSDSININVSINDSYGLIDTVIFALTNSSATQNSSMNYTASQQDSGLYWNATFDTNGFADGIYNITVWANDTVVTAGSLTNNINNSEVVYTVTFDNTVPSSVTLTESNSTQTTLGIDISVSDATSGIGSTCSVGEGTGTKSVSGTGTTQTLIVTGLSCGHFYSYIVTCSDRAGNSKASSSTTFSTSSCASTGVDGTTSSWTGTTYVVNDEQFEEGYTKEIAVKSRMKVKVGNTYHHIGVKALTATTATIEIASDPVDIILDIEEDAKVDVTDDGFYDIYVILNSIVNNKAGITVQKIHEEIPEGEGPVATTGEVTDGEEEEEEEEAEETNLTWLWILIGILVLAAIAGGAIAVKKRKK